MCGRFTLRASAQTVAEQFALIDLPPLVPRYNIAPRQPIGIVRLRRDPFAGSNAFPPSEHSAGSQRGATNREFAVVRWGLVPSWANDPAIGDRLINARAETVASKPAFRSAFRYRRCLIPADGFYEWAKVSGRKKPFFFRLPNDQLFAFAGLWEAWEGPDQSYLETATIITTEANEQVRKIHDRMPVILKPEDYSEWLDPEVSKSDKLMSLLRPLDLPLEIVPVGYWVNNPTFDDPRCVMPLG
ncbi:MAG: SOS response-associated peptidase [Thermoguttaceae bacterium]|nr:SOS response-associated peptidase [Thermoguttaceae bacterium]MDW8077408.1 SOS response-associated peptidase [Thermoguttaceae bacterium]